MTAIEWILDKINDDYLYKYYIKEIDQAKELQKQQIIEFTNDFIDKHTFGDYDGIVQKNKSIEEYYNEMFN